MFNHLSNLPVVPTLAAIALFCTVVSLLLQRLYGSHVGLIALGPALCVLGVLVFSKILSRGRRGK